MNKANLKVMVLCGGTSSEREVSLRSGKNCHEALLRLGYNSEILDFRGKDELPILLAYQPDLVMLTTHGTAGEDGAIQGMLDWLQIPYTGSGLEASSLCMDKYLCKLLLKEAGLPVSEGCLWNADLSFEKLCDEWQCDAIFYKPRWGGSSVGAGIIRDSENFNSLEAERNYLLLEPFTPGKEVTVGYLQDKGDWQCLPMLELRPKKEFYDYEAKYTEGMTEFILPAEIDTETQGKLAKWGRQALDHTGASGVGRVDFILTDEKILVLEINTLPGMTNTSDLPAQAKCAGIEYDTLVEKILKTKLS